MKIVGLLLARNEDWVLGLSLRAALMWCDEVVVLLHNCTDGTAGVFVEVFSETRKVSLKCEKGGTFNEMELRQKMLTHARYLGATHIVTIDADEVLSGNLLPTIREEIAITPPAYVLQLPWLQMIEDAAGRQIERPLGVLNSEWLVMSSGMWARQNVTVAFPDDPEYHWKARAGYDHHHRHPMGLPFQPFTALNDFNFALTSKRLAGLMHLQFLSRRRLIAKQFWYQLTERLRWGFDPSVIRQRYVPTVEEADTAKVSACPDSWWAPYSHLMQYLHIDREPWQEGECKRILMENPGIAEGLDDFGLLRKWGIS